MQCSHVASVYIYKYIYTVYMYIQCLHAKTHRAGEVVSVPCLLLGQPLLTQLNRSTIDVDDRPSMVLTWHVR